MDLDVMTAISNTYKETFDGTYFGIVRGVCVDNKDPMHLGRLRVYVPSVHGDIRPQPKELVWAWPCLSQAGASLRASLSIPDPESVLWIIFECGDTQHPIWLGSWWGVSDSNSDAPEELYDTSHNPLYNVIYRYEEQRIASKRDGEELLIVLSPTSSATLTKDFITLQLEDTAITLTSTAVTATEPAGAALTLQSGIATLSANGSSVVVQAGTVIITADLITLAGQVVMG